MIQLKERTLEHVKNYWYATQDEEINHLFPRSVHSLEESIDLFNETQSENATSFGKVIYVHDIYIGDVWVYNIDETVENMAMLSIVIFDKKYWRKGIGTKVIQQFLKLCFEKYDIEKMSAFTYDHNKGSIKALEKTGFKLIEAFTDSGVLSYYYELNKREFMK